MKLKLLILLVTCSPRIWSLQVVCIPGLGLDERAFEMVQFPDHCSVQMIAAPEPYRGEDMKSYAQRIVGKLQLTDDSLVLIGVSFGGMVAIEMAELIPDSITVQVIQISSCQHSRGVPKYYNCLRYIPLHYLVRGSVMELVAPFAVRGKMNDTAALLYQDMIYKYSEVKFRRFTSMVLSWKRTNTTTMVTSIHGELDGVLPLKYLGYKPDHTISRARHNLLFTHVEELNLILKQLL